MSETNKVFKINKLSSQYLEKNLASFLLIERDYLEPWASSNFLMELPLKWELSRYAEIDGILAGFIIASLRRNTVALHRFMIEPAYRDQKLGNRLHLAFEIGCREFPQVKRITLNVLTANVRAISFYEKLDYKIFDTKTSSLHCSMEKILF